MSKAKQGTTNISTLKLRPDASLEEKGKAAALAADLAAPNDEKSTGEEKGNVRGEEKMSLFERLPTPSSLPAET